MLLSGQNIDEPACFFMKTSPYHICMFTIQGYLLSKVKDTLEIDPGKLKYMTVVERGNFEDTCHPQGEGHYVKARAK